MKILITNDDSISSEVLLPLVKWAKQFGEVTVVVPKYEQSGKSHCIEIRKAFEVKQVSFDDSDIKAYTVDSSPADLAKPWKPQGNDMYFPTYKNTWTDSDDYSIDTNATLSGYISVTPLTLDRTNRTVFEELNKLNS